MCGRFVSASPPDQIAAYFSATEVSEQALESSWNVAPTSDVYVVVQDGGVRRVTTRHWGLVPFWAKEAKVGNRMINARAETVATSGAFKRAFAKRRCLVPADGFYEWQRVPGRKNKQPYFIHRPDGEPFAFAGLWEVWRPKDDEGADEEGAEPLRSTTIITTSANEEMARIHDRMPVILPPSAWDAWLDPENDDLETLGQLLVPAPPALTILRPVSTDVNNVRNQGPHLTDPISEGSAPDAAPALFDVSEPRAAGPA
jgi:putative SOS response-associated peptidase YedK